MSRTAFFDVLEPRRLMSANGIIPPDGGDPSLDPGVVFQSAAAAANPALSRGRLSFRGTAAVETITLTTETGNKLAVTVNGTKSTFDLARVRSIDFRTEGGNDVVIVNLPTTVRLPLFVRGGDGNDVLTSNYPAFLDGGNGNDTLNGSAFGDKLVGGTGDDTLRSNGGRDIISAGSGKNRITYANGDVDFGDLRLRTDANRRLTISGSRGNDRFVLSREGTTGSVVRVSLGEQTTTFDFARVNSLRIDGGAGRDEIAQSPGLLTPTGLLGSRPFSKKSIEVG